MAGHDLGALPEIEPLHLQPGREQVQSEDKGLPLTNASRALAARSQARTLARPTSRSTRWRAKVALVRQRWRAIRNARFPFDTRRRRVVDVCLWPVRRLLSKLDPPVPGWLDQATWISEDVLAVSGWFHECTGEPVRVEWIVEGYQIEPRVTWFSFARPDVPGDDPAAGKVFVLTFPGTANRRATLRLALGNRYLSASACDLTRRMADPVAWGLALSGIAEDDRGALIGFLIGATIRPGEGSARGNRIMQELRTALRPNLPAVVVDPGVPRGLVVDSIDALDETTFVAAGWMRDDEHQIVQLTAVSPEGMRSQLLPQAYRFRRDDVVSFYRGQPGAPADRPGFISLFRLPAPTRTRRGWTVEIENEAGLRQQVAAPVVMNDTVLVRERLLKLLASQVDPQDSLIPSIIHPAIAIIQRQLGINAAVAAVDSFGPSPARPDVSIIVPLYKRIDFLEHQLAQFVHDPLMTRVELLYVLDSPEQSESVKRLADQLFHLYQIPFRLLTMRSNAGFAGATNAGAAYAHGRLLLLLNSDVMPDRPGWLERLVAFHDSRPNIGAVGPKLIYEDESLQHAGMFFSRSDRRAPWENRHFFKGLQRLFPAANVARPVPAVTAACLLISRQLYAHAGGLRGIFVQGDFEDSDLCFRLVEMGRENWYAPEVELYHLEGQSYPSVLRQLTWRYNAWLHTSMWGAQIEDVMARFESIERNGEPEIEAAGSATGGFLS